MEDGILKLRNAGNEQDLGIQYKALKPEVDKLNIMAAKRQQVQARVQTLYATHLLIALFVMDQARVYFNISGDDLICLCFLMVSLLSPVHVVLKLSFAHISIQCFCFK